MDKRLTRSRTNRMISGVCGGLAVFFGLDSSLVRIGVVLVCLITAFIPIGLIYCVMWAIVPEEL